MNFRDFAKNNIVVLDGAMGSELQKRGLKPGEVPEIWNISKSEIITEIHKEYFDAGANVCYTNTFGLNSLKFTKEEVAMIARAAVLNVKKAAELSLGKQEKFVALDIGPLGRLLKPFGDLEFEKAVELFSEVIASGVNAGADLIAIETMTDSYETKAAVLAAKEFTTLPIIVTNAYDEKGKLMTGAKPEAMTAMLEGLGVDYIGANCSFGPDKLAPVIDKFIEVSSLPIVLKPNAGLPRVMDGKTVYDLDAESFAIEVSEWIKKGVRLVGGCCGTSPEYIEKLAKKVREITSEKGFTLPSISPKHISWISSYAGTQEFGEKPVLIGERINPTGKPKFKEALLNEDINYLLETGIAEEEAGCHILDVNVGLPGIDEEAMMVRAIRALQGVTSLPLEIDTTNIKALESALRIYNGKALINSVNGKLDSMNAVFPLAKKYGGMIVCLTIDENGIPSDALGRLEIARKIVKTAESYGIGRENLIFDTLAMAISADKDAAKVTLDSLKMIKEELNVKTILGVSNISFGLPNRDYINEAFFSEALYAGLDSAIMNPNKGGMMKVYHAFNALNGKDENFNEYIEFCAKIDEIVDSQIDKNIESPKNDLRYAIEKGLKEEAREIAKERLKLGELSPLKLVENEIIPALDIVGQGFESGKVFLPGLLMAAEASKEAFEVVKANMPSKEATGPKVIVATVEGDIHDIGKNIAKLLLENYGFRVIDLGRDVKPEAILNRAKEDQVDFVGLSALMTTTVPAMEKTIAMLKKDCPNIKILVGGAVLNREYASKIGADFYAKDAMETVHSFGR